MHCTDSLPPVALDHATSPRNMGPMADFDGHATITGPCGDTMDFWVKIRDGFVEAATFTTDGCGSSRACGSMATVLATGRPLAAAMLVSDRDILHHLGGFPSAEEHCALLASNTLRAALEDHFRAGRPSRISRRILVLSGKGGVGKSTVAVQLACWLRDRGLRAGILDADIHGPTVPSMVGISDAAPERRDGMLAPVHHHGLAIMSVGLLLPHPDQPVAWRGPRKGSIVQQFFREVDWGDLDALVIDSPPGTGDELLSIVAASGGIDEAVVVTTPQKIAAQHARKAGAFCREAGIPVGGIVENMAGAACPRCGHLFPLLPEGPGRGIGPDMDAPFLGGIPFVPALAEAADHGRPLELEDSEGILETVLRGVFAPILARIPASGSGV